MRTVVAARPRFSIELPSPPLALFVLTMALVATGLIMVYSASGSPTLLARQSAYVAIGLAGMAFFCKVNYAFLRRFSPYMMLGSLVLLGLVYVVGISRLGGHRWLGIGAFNFQPSEMAKLALVIYMAKMLADRKQYRKSFFSGVLPPAILTGIFTAAIVFEPDFGAAFVLGATVFGMWVVAEMRWLHLMLLVSAAAPPAMIAFLMEPYRMQRLLAFMTQSDDAIKGKGMHLYQSLVAVGSGGVWGLGLGESVQKNFYLPEQYSDFIFAIAGEELGFLRMMLIVAAFLALTLIGWRVAFKCTDLFGALLASGITLMIFFNTAINMGVVIGLLPTKGLVLPFISYGGTAMVVYLSSMGILMNIACHEHARYAPSRA